MKYRKRVKDRFNHLCEMCNKIKMHHSKGVCKTCYNMNYVGGVINREKKREWYNNYLKNYMKKDKYGVLAFKKHQLKYPLKVKARQMAKEKIKIPLNQLCVSCNERKATDRHHEDYNKPLEVVFLCHSCHMSMHKIVN